jgi:hypothetical protein
MVNFTVYDPKATGPLLPELSSLPIGALVAGLLDLLEEASDLPQPRYIAVSETQHFGLQFDPEQSSFRAITRWALRFGGILTSEPYKNKDGSGTFCGLNFDYYGVPVEAYAYVVA